MAESDNSLGPREENIEGISSSNENNNRRISSYCTTVIEKITFFGYSDTRAAEVEFRQDEKNSKSICILQ